MGHKQSDYRRGRRVRSNIIVGPDFREGGMTTRYGKGRDRHDDRTRQSVKNELRTGEWE